MHAVPSVSADRRVLITGGTGLLGQGLVATTPPGWSILSLHRRSSAATAPGVTEVVADVRDRAALERLFARERFDAVVHAAGIASVDASERNVEESTASNLGGTRHVAELCAAFGVRLVYVSTNAVFDGTRPPYRETDAVNPINAYGRIKVACERLVQETLGDAAIVRPILMYGWPHPMGRPNPVTWVIDALERGEPIHVVDDVCENPLHNETAGTAIWRIVERGVGGIVHLAGRDAISRYELARSVARLFELDASKIRAVPSSFFPDLAPRPRNTTMATTRMSAELGVSPSTVEEGLMRMVATMQRQGRR
jgi:dTDP-4-dehydrorhamnose reductase